MIFLAFSSGYDADPVARELDGYGLSVDLLSAGVPWDRSGALEGIRRALAVLPELDLVAAGEQVSRLRARLPPDASLLICCPPLASRDREALLGCGASAVVAPRDWSPTSVAERLLGELASAGEIVPSQFGSFRGASRMMREVYHQIETLGPLAETILLLGETGTGKELAARELHAQSGRPGQLTVVNCPALPSELVESELFGHEKGAYTGAGAKRQGLLVAAGRGTVFLDEVGDLAPTAQAKLLRVLEDRSVRPVGSDTPRAVDARVVLATNVDLGLASKDGRFRPDLFHRLRGFTIILPPLRERRADVPLLVQHFVDEYNRDYAGERTIPPGAMDALFRYDWPGNVRELRQAVRQAAAFSGGDDKPISALHLLEVVQQRASDSHDHGRHAVAFDPATETWRQVHDRARRRYVHAVLAETGGNREAAAKRAGISRSRFFEILKQIEESEDP